MGTSWSDADKDRLRRLAPDHSYNVIADIMHRTKNAVIGEAHRLRLPRRRPTIVSVRARAPTRRSDSTRRSETELGLVPRPIPPPCVAVQPVFAAPAARPLAPQPRRPGAACCWPLGDPHSRSFRFCEAPVTRGAYCTLHAEMGYVVAPPLKAAAS